MVGQPKDGIDVTISGSAGDDDATVAAAAIDVDSALREAVIESGSRIGGYRLLREIGRGGMGSVFLAQREDREFKHQVAIKVVRGFPTHEILERFRRERELLATLRHPHIARLYDGGTTEAGQPWLAMEHVDGRPLDQWCRDERPSLTQRLRLFQSLCAAVQHAHQQLIVHRDLKPANVLVRDNGEPVLLDFGIGKLLDGQGDSRETILFQALTPAYASPEQLRGESVTTLSDIFGLGLILFELLSGVPLRKQAGDTTRLMPSRVAGAGDDWLRGEARLLRGDLDNIVRKALREEPERRYQTVAALSADLDAWSAGMPVSAAPDSWRYRVGKFVRRHPLALGATVVTIIALAVLSARLATERDRAIAAQAQAQREAEGANQSAQFLVDLFARASPETTRGRAITVRGLIEGASDELEGRQFSRPAVKARLELALGEIYISLGLPELAVENLGQAVARLRGEAGEELLLVTALRQLTRAHDQLGQSEIALGFGTEALALARRALPADSLATAHALQTLGVTEAKLRQFDSALPHFEEAGALFGKAGRPEQVGASLHNQGWALGLLGRDDEALPVLEQALQLKREGLGTDQHPSVLVTLSQVASVQARLGQRDQAIEGLRHVLTLERSVIGEPSAKIGSSFNELGSTLHDAFRYEEAEQAYRSAIDQYRQLGQDDSAELALPINNLATLMEDLGRLDEAVALYRRSLAMRQASAAPTRSIAHAQANLARALILTGQAAEAREMANAALVTRSGLPSPSLPERVDLPLLLSRLDSAGGDTASAATRLQQVRDVLAGETVPVPAPVRARVAMAEAALAAATGDDAGRVAAEARERGALLEFLPASNWRLRRLDTASD